MYIYIGEFVIDAWLLIMIHITILYNFQFDLDAIISCSNYINGKPKTQLQHKYLCNKICVVEQNVSSSCQFCILSTTIYTCHWWAQHVFFKYSVGMLPVSFCYMHVQCIFMNVSHPLNQPPKVTFANQQ